MRRFFQAKDVLLLKAPIGNAGVNSGKTTYFSVRTPSVRLTTTLSFFYWQYITGQSLAFGANPGLSVPFSLSGQLNSNGLILYGGEQAETGWIIPTSEIVGTIYGSGYQTVPAQWASGILSGLTGLSVDVNGGQQWIGGIFGAGGCPAGYANQPGVNLSLRVKWENAPGADICEDEWRELLPLMVVNAPDPVIYT